MKTTYDFAVGTLFIIVALVFFFAPAVVNMDPFIPFILSFVSFALGVSFFLMGRSENNSKKS